MAKAKRANSNNDAKSIDAAARSQALAMWALLGEGGEAFGGKLTPEIDKKQREALQEAGLIEVEKKKNGAYWLAISDKGWEWAEQHMTDPLPLRSQSGAIVLQAWLKRVQKFLHSRDLRLYQLFAAGETVLKSSPDPSPEFAEIREHIRAAYIKAAGGFDRRLLLRDLRLKLTGIDRHLVDSALLRMMREGEVSLMQLDYRPDVTDEDRAASVQIGTEPRHIIWIAS